MLAEHPGRFGIVNYLGGRPHAHGDLAEAEAVVRRALANLETVLAADDEDALETSQDLADLLEKIDRPEEARPLRPAGIASSGVLRKRCWVSVGAGQRLPGSGPCRPSGPVGVT